MCVGTSTVARNDDGDSLGVVDTLDGDSVTALRLYALRPFMFSLLISDGFLGLGSAGGVGDLSMEGYSGKISLISGVGEGADEVEARRNLKGFFRFDWEVGSHWTLLNLDLFRYLWVQQ